MRLELEATLNVVGNCRAGYRVAGMLWITCSVALASLILLSPLVFASDSLPQFDRVMVLSEPREIADAQLINHNGEPFRLSQLRGKVSLIFFGFTNCPDVCPAAMAKFTQLERSGLVNPDRVNFTMISVDGERDSPAVMQEYLHQFSELFIGLTGDSADVRKIASAFRPSFNKGETRVADSSYNVAHSTQVFLLDQGGRLRAELHSPTVEAMAGITNTVLAETEP
jgi:protein SCO1/2